MFGLFGSLLGGLKLSLGGHKVALGNSKSNKIEGGHKSDLLFGGKGDDAIYGNGGNDKLVGGKGSDYLDGGSGNDTLIGAAGDDYLIGGSGKDTFVFGRNDGNDTIADFEIGRDMVDVRAYREYDSLDDLNPIQDTDGSVLLQLNPYNSIRLMDTDLNKLSDGDFWFA